MKEAMPTLKTNMKTGEIQEGQLAKVEINDKSVVLGKISGKIYAMDSVCSHEGGPLEEGELHGFTLVCPWHQGKFDIRSAKASPDTDWVTDLHSYQVVVDNSTGEISINTG